MIAATREPGATIREMHPLTIAALTIGGGVCVLLGYITGRAFRYEAARQEAIDAYSEHPGRQT